MMTFLLSCLGYIVVALCHFLVSFGGGWFKYLLTNRTDHKFPIYSKNVWQIHALVAAFWLPIYVTCAVNFFRK